MTATALSLDAVKAAVERLPDDALAPARRAALDALRKHGTPTTRDEDWKYTDLKTVLELSNRWLERPATEPTPTSTDQADSIIRAIDADWLVVSNGRIDARGLEEFAANGVSISRLSERGIEPLDSAKLGNLNTALLVDGLRIDVSAGTRVDRPIGLLFVDSSAAEPVVSQFRVDITVGASAAVSFVEFHASDGGAENYSNLVISLSVERGAETDYVRVQERNRAHDQTTRLSANVSQDARLQHAAFDLGGRLVRNDLDIRLSELSSHVSINGLYLVGNGQHIDNHTRVDHVVGPAESRQEYRGILTGRARGVWNGKAIVHEGADGTDAEQSNHNLLLSRNAEINAKPELEIYADDVKCSHGTTVGQLDRNAMFYLRTRGLSRHDARQVLTRAFAQAIVSQSPIERLQEWLAERIAARLDELMLGADE